MLPDWRWLQAPTEAARLNARPLQGHSRGKVNCLLATGNWRMRDEPCMSKFCAIHVRTSPLVCTAVAAASTSAVFPVCTGPLASVGAGWPRRGAGARPGEPTPAYAFIINYVHVPAVTAGARGRPFHTGIQLACAYSCTSRGARLRTAVLLLHAAPLPPRPVFLGAGAEPNPEAAPSGAGPCTGKISKSAKFGGNR